MKNLCFLSIVTIPILIISSCQLKFDDTSPNPDLRLPFENLEELFERQTINADTFSINASMDETLNTSSGAKILVNAGSFEKNNQPVDGNILVITKEPYEKSEMILLNKPSTSGNTILEYGGILVFNAYKDGEAIDLQSPITLTLPVNNQISALGDMFHFKNDNDWMIVNNSQVDVNPSQMTLQFDSEDQGWMCGATEPDFSDFTNIEASIFGYGTILTDITGFIVLSDYNTVIKMDSDINGIRVSKSNVPKGVQVSIVVLAMDHLKLFVGIKNVDLTDDNLSIEINMDHITEADLPEYLEIVD